MLPVVATVTTNGTGTPLATLICAGEVQLAAVGAPAHVEDTLPLNPGVSCRLNVAVCPAVTVAERLPPVAGVIVSNGFALPVMATVCGELGASSVIVSVAVRTPVADGVKVSPIVHAVFTGYAAAVHPSLRLKSPALAPLIFKAETCRGAVPALVIVMFCCVLVVPWAIAAKTIAAGAMVTADLATGAPVPVPLSGTVCVDPGASSAMTIEALRSPSANGENVTLMAQLAFTVYAPLHPFVSAKSPGFEPLRRTDET